MYSIYSTTAGKTICIHDDSVADPSVKVLDPKLKLGDSNAGSLQFKIAPNNVAFGTYEYSETIATGVQNVGSVVDLVSDNALEQGSIDSATGQNDDENQNEVRTAGYLNKNESESEPAVNTISIIPVGHTTLSDISVYTGVSKDKKECTSLFSKGWINGSGTIVTTNQYYVSTEQPIPVTAGDVIGVHGDYQQIGIKYEVKYYDVNGTYKGGTGQILPTNTYTLPGTAKYMKINICRADGAQIDLSKVKNVYIYINGINYFSGAGYSASSEHPCEAYQAYVHTAYIPVTGNTGRLYHKFEFNNPLADIYNLAEQGNVTAGGTNNIYIVTSASTKSIRINADLYALTGFQYGSITPGYAVNIELSQEKRAIVNVYPYFEGTGQITSPFSFNSDDSEPTMTIRGSSKVWINIAYEDGTDITPSDLEKFELLFDQSVSPTAYIEATVGLYYESNGEYEYLGDGTPLSDSIHSAADLNNKYVDLEYYVAAKNKTANYISITYCMKPNTQGNVVRVLRTSDFKTLQTGIGKTINVKVFQYDKDGAFIGASDADKTGGFSLNQFCKTYRLTFRCDDSSALAVFGLESADVQRYALITTTETKTIDPLSRLISTITVKRSTWGYTRLPNIGESGTVNVISTNNITGLFEQGTIDANGADYASGYYLRTSAISMDLAAGDYISVDASITESDTTVDGINSSTVRRPIYFKVHFYSGSTHAGFVDNIAGGGDCIVPSNLSQYPITNIRIVIWGSDRATLNLKMLDYAKLYSTRNSIFGADVTPCETIIDGVTYAAGDLVPNEYTVTSKELELTMAANTAINTYTAQIEAQSRQGVGFFWGLAMYNASHQYIGMYRWLDQTTRFDEILSGTKYIRIILKYKTDLTKLEAKELPPNDISVLNVTCTRFSKTRTEEEIWEGRILSEDVDFKKCRVIYCEGELSYLNDTRQPPRVYEGSTFRNYISKIIEVHNSKVDDTSYYVPLESMPLDWADSYTNYYLRTGLVGNYTYTRLTKNSYHVWHTPNNQDGAYCEKVISTKKFILGTTWEPTKKKGEEWETPDPNDDISRHVTNFETTLECLNNLVTDYGGHLRIRKVAGNRYIDWLEDYPTKSNQVINFGENLLDFTRKTDLSKLCTAVYPTGEVLVQAKSSAVGDHVPKEAGKWDVYEHTLLYQNEDDGKIYMNRSSNLNGYLTVIATVETSTVSEDGSGDKSYYFSGRLHGGFVAYWVTDDAGNFYNGGIEIAGDERPDTGFVDYVDHKITMPPGANKIWMCSFGSSIPLALKKETKETTGLDEVLTITDCATDKDFVTGKIWHTKGSPYITNPDAVTKYGWIEHRLDLSNLKDKDALYSAAKTYLQKGQFEDMTLEVSAIDLNSLGVDTDYINLLDKVRCVSDPHGLDQEFPVTELEIPLNDPANQKFRLGNKNEVNLSTQTASTNTELLQKIEKAPSSESVIRTALQTAAASIANVTGGSYINYRYDDDGHPIEMIISKEAPTVASDPTTIPSGSTWRWNRAGLAHSDGGYDPAKFADQANIAITEAGKVIANEILGQFILGYTLGGAQLVIGSDVGTTKEQVQAKLPSGITSAISIHSGDGNSTVKAPYIDMYNGELHFGLKESGIRSEYGLIQGTQSIPQPGGGTHDGLYIKSDGVIVINTPDLGIGTGGDLSNVYQTVQDWTGTIDGVTLTFKNGMLINVQ